MTAAEGEAAGQLGKYRRIAAVGQGGMADVWLVVMLGPAGFSKLLALKELKAELCSNPEFVSMVLAEARLAARLSHPNIVQTYEVGLNGRRPGIVMEWLEGQPLLALQRQVGRSVLPLEAHVFVIAKVLEALEYAHEARDFDGTPLGVVHRDISPHNVFVGYNGSVKLMDFGIAKIAGAESHTEAGLVKGKVGYVSPEQVGSGQVDHRTDIFSTGVMLWEALVGRRLSAGDPRDVALAKRLQGIHEPVLRLVPNAPRKLVAIVERAMARSPDDRYPTAAAMRADLEAWLAEHRMSEREIASLTTAAFAEERQHVHKLIEQQMRALQAEQPSAQEGLPIVALKPLSQENTSTPTPLSAGKGADAGAGASQSLPFGVSTPAVRGTRRARRRLALVVAALAVCALAAALLSRRRAARPEAMTLGSSTAATVDGPAAVAAGAPGAPAPAPAPAPAAREIELNVSSQPPGAKVYLDGKLLGQSPVRKRLARDDEAHSLRLSAPGYRDDERALDLSQDRSLELALKPQGRRDRPPKPAPTDEPKPDRPRPPARDARPIEESNPY